MKKGILFVALIMIMPMGLMAQSDFSPFNYSFRMESTGHLLFGDFDNDMDPIYIHDNEGYRHYSMFSNMQNSGPRNRFLSGSTDNHSFLMGASGQFGIPSKFPWESRTFFVVQLADSRQWALSGLDLNFDGFIDETGFGEMSGNAREYTVWNPVDLQYDLRSDYTATADNYSAWRNRDWHITHSFSNGDKRLGFSFTHMGLGNNSFETNTGGSSFAMMVPDEFFSFSKTAMFYDVSSTVTSPTLTNSFSRVGDFHYLDENPANVVKVSYQMPFSKIANSDLRFDLLYAKFNNKSTRNDMYTTYSEFFPTPVVPIRNDQSESYTMTSDRSGSIIMPGVQLTKHWNPDTYSWFRVDFGFGSEDAIQNTMDHYTQSDVNDVAITLDDHVWMTDYTGDYSNKGLRFFHKTVADLSPDFTVACGFEFSTSTSEADNLAYSMTETQSNSFEDGGFNAVTDFRHTMSSSQTGTATHKETDRDFTFPAGMEYTQGRWTFRLGGYHQISTSIGDTTWTGAASTFSDTTLFGDGSGSGAIIPPPANTKTVSEKREWKTHYTSFYYGLSFKANEHLTIELLDFLGSSELFNSSDFYRELQMSLTLRL